MSLQSREASAERLGGRIAASPQHPLGTRCSSITPHPHPSAILRAGQRHGLHFCTQTEAPTLYNCRCPPVHTTLYAQRSYPFAAHRGPVAFGFCPLGHVCVSLHCALCLQSLCHSSRAQCTDWGCGLWTISHPSASRWRRCAMTLKHIFCALAMLTLTDLRFARHGTRVQKAIVVARAWWQHAGTAAACVLRHNSVITVEHRGPKAIAIL